MRWTDKLSPSFLNIIKSLLIHGGHMSLSDKIAQLRSAAERVLPLPPAWFDHTQSQGVMWLNQALTFSSKEIPVLKQHTAFWKPIINEIFRILIEAKQSGSTRGFCSFC